MTRSLRRSICSRASVLTGLLQPEAQREITDTGADDDFHCRPLVFAQSEHE